MPTMPLFQPKHQKLILQCYPPGRGFDKKPNSSELSYLLYYASTRRVKLEKVGRFLEKKNAGDIAHGRTGNVQVTLDIVDQLMNKCPDDVSVFAENVAAILSSVAASGDLGLCQHAEPVYHTFCQTLNGDLITGDQDFVTHFVKLTQKILSLGTTQQKANPTDWKAIALNATASFATSKFISLGKAKEVLSTAIPFVLNEMQTDFSEGMLLKRIASHTSEQHSLSRFNTVRTVNRPDEEPSTPREIKTDEMAVNALKAFFHTNSAAQLSTSTKFVSSYLAKSGVDQDWAAAVTEMVATWIPVQLRFLILSILVAQLDKNGSVAEQTVYLHVIARLLASSVNLVGLSVIDNLRQLIDLQYHLLGNPQTPKELTRAYSDAIGSLAVHIYYSEQIVDMVGELLIKLKESIDKPTLTSNNTMMVLMENIKTILITAQDNATVQRARVPLELFSSTFSLLSYNDASLPLEGNFLIQKRYTDLLITDLKLEYTNDDTFIPDHNNLISGAHTSVINELFEQLGECTKLPRGTNYDAIVSLIEIVTEKFGINAAVNGLPLLFEWQLTQEKEQDRSVILRDNIGFVIVYFATKALQFGGLLNEVLCRIDYRKLSGIWLLSSVIPLEKSSIDAPKLTVTKKEVEAYIGEGSLLQSYRDTIFTTHYRYNNNNANGNGLSNDTYEDAPETSFVSENPSQNVSLSNLLQPTIVFNGDNNSIKSAPLSARSLLIGRLNVPKVQELRKAISGTSLKRVDGLKSNGHSNNGTSNSRQRTDAMTLLNDLSLDDELDDYGRITA